ncbi:MAG TPA: hypothetical protein VGZ27_12665 [Vicinamibacterales bacterium]|nr:hypothetical protein [Vicinamibacterales bacterium]
MRTSVAAAGYFFIAIAFTWPLLPGLTHDIPWDLGDSLLNCWILGWDADHLLRFLSGHLHALGGLWDANIFYPEPLTLAYSEHLFAQAVQILPVYALTHNIILCYNLLFLSTFVLSGLGMFLFVREVTGSRPAGFAAGLIYAFAPMRVPQFAHLQVMSSQWMPFVLYGLRRYFDTRRLRPLAGAGAALVAQNLSCGYFLMFFAPCVVAYTLFEVASRRLWGDWRIWTSLGITATAVGLVTLPFLLPYLELRWLGFPPRSLTEVESYAADVYSYWTSPAESRLWGRAIRAFPKMEGDLFPGFSALILGAIGLVAAVRAAWARSHGPGAAHPIFTIFVYVVTAGAALYTLFLALILTGHGFAGVGPLAVSVKSPVRNFQILLAALAALLATSPRARSFAAHFAGSVTGIAVLLALLTFLLSLGPQITIMGRTLSGTAPYAFFFWHVPGFDGLRVPARYGMLVMMFLSIAAGSGAFDLQRRFRHGALTVVSIGFFAVAESFAAPIVVNGTVPVDDYETPPSRVFTGEQVPAVYKFLGTLPADTIVAEFPLGEWAYELRYVFYSTVHWHPLINGYSGTFPLSYSLRAFMLRQPEDRPDDAWDSLVASGATHAVVHETYYKDGRGKAVSQWLSGHGARLAAEFDGDKVYIVKSER